jgi:AraC-like DNA-binding protein
MDYAEFASDLPLKGRISFSSAEENEEIMRQHGITQQVRQLGKGRFRADYAMLETSQAILTADRFSRACSVYLEPPPGTVALIIFRSARGKFLASGEDVANDKLVVLRDGHGTDLVSAQLAGSDAVVLPEPRYAEMMQALCPTCALPEGTAILKGDQRQLHRIRDTAIQTIVDARPKGEEVANLVASLLAWAGYSSSNGRPAITYRKQSKSHVAKQAQAYIEEHYHESVRIEDLCRATGKEVRTLQRCFREYFDITITDYLKMVRLNSARRALSRALPDEETVASVALQNGFTHFGRFSVEYKNRFGESASETLSR